MAYQFKTRSTTPTEKRLTDGACAHLFAEQQALNSDPGVANVLSPTSYDFNGSTLIGEYVPAGGTGDATAANQTTIINHLMDIKGAGFSGTTDSNEAISNAVAAITPGTPINVTSQTTIIAEG